MSRIEYLEAAEEEFLSEIGYLEERSPGLGRRFITEVHKAEALIVRFPVASGSGARHSEVRAQ